MYPFNANDFALVGYIAVIGYNRALIGNTYLFQVAKHKTAESGPAVLAVNPKLYGYLRLYLDMLVSYRDTIWTMKEAYLHLGRKQMEQWH
jgi:hypothetical protein